ncbi:MAG TPA: Ig-like domain-containing protein [Actinomycetes bacterium]|nr:Ig-like domain-containing protein [Actinomycetes bacterium]
MHRVRFPDVTRRPLLLVAVLVGVLVVALAGVGLARLAGHGGGVAGALRAVAHGAAPTTPPARVTVLPRNGARGVALDAQAKVAVEGGRIRSVRVTDPAGQRLPGLLLHGGRSWASTGALAPATRYRLVVEAVNGAGSPTRRVSSFTTLRPVAQLRASIMPLDGETVGVGLPIGVWFNQPVADRAAVERHLQVASSKPVKGAWHWFNDREVHYRPRSYWPAGAQVTLAARLAGVDAGQGVWGVADRTVRFRIGDRHVSIVNVNTHRMKVTSGGHTLKVLPVSTGREKYPTTNGVHFVVSKAQDELMDSATVGIPRDSPDGYYEHVFWSVRISDSGEFVHAAPWSVASQGNANVSHGCVNLSTEDATWFFKLARRGDVVEVVGSPKKPGRSFGTVDWNLSWAAWTAGSALRG